eukprot:gene5055-5104_t
MDGSVSTLAPIFATAGLTHAPIKAFYVGLAASLGAGISMGLAEALSDDGGMLHTLPFLINNIQQALHVAYGVVVFELLAIAAIRYKFMKTPLVSTVLQVIVGGGIVFLLGIYLEPVRVDVVHPGQIKRNSAGIRLWHWANAVVISGSLITVLINSTITTREVVVPIVTDELKQAGLTVSKDQARGVAHALGDKCWSFFNWPIKNLYAA